MTRLQCRVDSCGHYENGLCLLSKIRVDGPGACDSGQTCCMSFEEKNSPAENSAGNKVASETASIECLARECVHNKADRCAADCVCVGCCCGGEASVLSETECCTFEKK